MRAAMPLRALLALLIAVSICGVRTQLVGFTPQTQYDDTKISNISCDTVQGYLLVTIFNGFTETREFYVSGQSDGVDAPLDPVPTSTEINGRTSGQLTLFGPSSGAQGSRSIVGVRSKVTAFMVDPLAISGVSVIGHKFYVCGNNYSSPCDCGFFNYFCQIDDCSPDQFAWFWMVNDFLIALIVSIFGLLMIWQGSTWQMRVNDHFASNITEKVPTQDNLSEQRFSDTLKRGDMTVDDLRSLRDELRARVHDASHMQGLRMADEEAQAAEKLGNAKYDQEVVHEGMSSVPQCSRNACLTIYFSCRYTNARPAPHVQCARRVQASGWLECSLAPGLQLGHVYSSYVNKIKGRSAQYHQLGHPQDGPPQDQRATAVLTGRIKEAALARV